MNDIHKSAWFPGAVIFVGAALWGLYWLPLRYIEAAGLNGLWSIFAINIVPLVALFPLAFHRRKIIQREAAAIAIIGLMTGLGLVCYSIGLIYTSIMRATLLFYLTPIWSTLFAFLILKERAGWQRWAAIAVGFAGLFLMLSAGGSSANPLNVGDLAGFMSGVFWGFGATGLRRWPHIGPSDSVPSQYLFGTLVTLLAIAIAGTSAGQVPAIGVFWEALPAIIFFYVLLVVPSLFAIFWAAQRVSPGRTGILMMSEVIVAGISAPLLAGEYLSRPEMLGAALIVAAGLIEVLGPAQTGEKSAA
ncbi:MAG: DMT family transporter [Hyphomicrobiales bacterium]